MLASELMEAGRAVAAGFVTPERTLAIASTARSHVMDEKIAMADGRHDSAQLEQAIAQRSRQHVLIDMAAIARRAGTMVNAVMLGALAGCGRLPIPLATFEAAIRQDGKAVKSNLRGFRAGLAAARGVAPTPVAASVSADALGRGSDDRLLLDDFVGEMAETPAVARDIVELGLLRLARYQDLAYARIYLNRLIRVRAADEGAHAGGCLLAETARHLALRMSYEDVVKVAEAKIDPARVARIRAEIGARTGDPVMIADFLKPGIEEFCSFLPSRLARPILGLAQRFGWLGRFHWGLELKSTAVAGFLRFWLITKLRRFRPRSHRFGEEQRAIEAWLGLVVRAAAQSADLAFEVVECARLIKGYGDTYKRGSANYDRIAREVIIPALAGHIPVGRAIDAIASARAAALADPDGESLNRCLAEIGAQAASPLAAE
jgi:indolepyruvate ferredoxin oxidoreductase beta subunit